MHNCITWLYPGLCEFKVVNNIQQHNFTKIKLRVWNKIYY